MPHLSCGADINPKLRREIWSEEPHRVLTGGRRSTAQSWQIPACKGQLQGELEQSLRQSGHKGRKNILWMPLERSWRKWWREPSADEEEIIQRLRSIHCIQPQGATGNPGESNFCEQMRVDPICWGVKSCHRKE